jgi:hypothetical protein
MVELLDTTSKIQNDPNKLRDDPEMMGTNITFETVHFSYPGKVDLAASSGYMKWIWASSIFQAALIQWSK